MGEHLTIEKVFNALGGKGNLGNLSPSIPYKGVTIDSREECRGRIFVALKGERSDGHDFIPHAIAKGAVLAISERPVDAPHIEVESSLEALHRLAALVRANFEGRVVAITGTNGKTTTKEMLSCILRSRFKVHSNQGNLNNLIGMPLTLANTPEDAEILVLEMGTNQEGELTTLSHLGRPQVAVITTIGQGHLGPLGGPQGVKRAKMEILKGIEPGGWLVTNGDNPLCREIPFPQKLTFGLSGGEVRAKVVEQNLEGSRFVVNLKGEETEVELRIPGLHHVYNALASIATAHLVSGLAPRDMAHALRGFTPAWGRCLREEVKGVTVINDAYNSNPDSLAAALKTLATATGGRRVAVVGDMLELGEYAQEAHRQAGRLAAELGIDLLCTYGELASLAAEEASKGGIDARSFTSHREIAELLSSWLKPGDLVLVKGSRGMRMERVIEMMKGEP